MLRSEECLLARRVARKRNDDAVTSLASAAVKPLLRTESAK
jgi:hypothetical protein